MNFADAPAKQLELWVAEEMPAMNLMTVTDSMPEGTAIVDCGAALDCMGDNAAAKTAQAIMASGETRLPEIIDKEQTFKFGGDGGPKKANFAVIFPVTIGETQTWIEAFVIEGNTPHLVSRRWLSKHKCLVCFDPDNLYLESPEFGRISLILHSSGHLLLSLIGKSKGSAAVHFVLPGVVDGPLQMGGVPVCDRDRRQVEGSDADDGRDLCCSYCLDDHDAESDDLDPDRGRYLGTESDPDAKGEEQGGSQGQDAEQSEGQGTAEGPSPIHDPDPGVVGRRERDPTLVLAAGLRGGCVGLGGRGWCACAWACFCCGCGLLVSYGIFFCRGAEADDWDDRCPKESDDEGADHDDGGVLTPAAYPEDRPQQQCSLRHVSDVQASRSLAAS